MHTNHEPVDPDVLREMGYDRRDLQPIVIRNASIGFVVFAVVSWILGWFFFRVVAPDNAKGAIVAETRRVPEAPNPLLQDNVTTKIDIMQMRQDEEKALNETAWLDQRAGKVRIPVSRAIELIAQRGVSTGQSVDAKSTGNTIPQNAVAPGN